MFLFTFVLCVVLAVVNPGQAAPAKAHKGDATFFTPGVGACGKTSTSSQHIVALSHTFFDTFPGAGANPNKNPLCGKKITVHFGSKSTQATVVDRCPGCAVDDIDLSPAAFNALASPDKGRIKVSWTLD